uniref:Uncharacterized protein n=1 Tax=Arundo donax TaxID=35708 RepID=A0A0A9I3T5_ARUDO
MPSDNWYSNTKILSCTHKSQGHLKRTVGALFSHNT